MIRASVLACMCCASAAWAYRPFDGTDADTAKSGEIELEVGPVGFFRSAGEKTFYAPFLIFNLGITPGWELVIQARNEISGLVRIANTGAFVKTVLREGVLQ